MPKKSLVRIITVGKQNLTHTELPVTSLNNKFQDTFSVRNLSMNESLIKFCQRF
jgi:hypothetical protein